MAVLRKLCFAQCYKSLSELALWLTLSCLLFAGKDHAPLDDDIQASMAAFFHFSVTLHGRQQSMPDVYVKAHPWYKVLGPARAQGWDYLFDLPETASISIRMEEGIHPYIESVSISCPDFVDAALYPLLDRLPAMLADAARDAHGAPPVFFESQSAAACKALLVVILEERVFTDLSEPALSRVCIRLSWVWSYTVAEILSAPRSVGEGEPCTVLTTAQRMEWVLRGGRNANSELVNKREDYLRELQDAARGAER
ncbi:hypothetical protein PsYK624_123360 [Phanerochaete sordida]|uniref:Uncharacterized protein n=1 Tax=Phanerochaete sordida TaxID=48140 RepID=A0A9P3GJM0_9APHY|nr:hypothetical protein PsYK624_123360 [Phanerochaete sordida]